MTIIETRIPAYDASTHRPAATFVDEEDPHTGVILRTLQIERRPLDDIRRDLEIAVGLAIAAIKAEAQRRIYAVAPAWRQANMQAVMTRLLGRNAGLSRSEWSADDLAAAATGEALFDQIDAIRNASNDIEAAVIALAEIPGTTAADVAAWDVNTGWPA